MRRLVVRLPAFNIGGASLRCAVAAAVAPGTVNKMSTVRQTWQWLLILQTCGGVALISAVI